MLRGDLSMTGLGLFVFFSRNWLAVAEVLEGELPAAAKAAGAGFQAQATDFWAAVGLAHGLRNVRRHLEIGVATAVFWFESGKEAVTAVLPAHLNFNPR
jgi:hypothetical protein